MSDAPFTLEAKAGTFIWRHPPKQDTYFNVPTHHKKTLALSTFQRARLTTSAKSWHIRNDHGGLLLAISRPHTPPSESPLRWVRVGPELLKDGVAVTVSACDRYADQSMHAMDQDNETPGEVTVEVRRVETTLSATLWVYLLVMSAAGQVLERVALRQLAWFFDGEDDGLVLDVAAYAARPAIGQAAQGESLELRFSNFLVEGRE